MERFYQIATALIFLLQLVLVFNKNIKFLYTFTVHLVHFKLIFVSIQPHMESSTKAGQKKEQEESRLPEPLISWGDVEKYQIVKKLGRGTYAQVFLANNIVTGRPVAIKILRPIRKSKIIREYRMLSCLQHPNLIRFHEAIRCPDAKVACFITDYYPHDSIHDLITKGRLNLADIKNYMQQLLKVLAQMHSKGIMHRDIKPQNILIDHSNCKLTLIDLGLAEEYEKGRSYSPRICTLNYRPPELFLGWRKYDYSIDMWGVGLVLASMLFRKMPFISGADVADQCFNLAKIVGTNQMIAFCYQNEKLLAPEEAEFRVHLLAALVDEVTTVHPKVDFMQLASTKKNSIRNEQACDLLGRILTLDPVFNLISNSIFQKLKINMRKLQKKRITAAQALEHEFFKLDLQK